MRQTLNREVCIIYELIVVFNQTTPIYTQFVYFSYIIIYIVHFESNSVSRVSTYREKILTLIEKIKNLKEHSRE